MDHDTYYMNRCIELARLGRGYVAPNPLVGAVVVHEGKIIGEGYHRKFGGPHAEVIAIASVKQRKLLPHSTLYVTLEPCAHYGKTPPCSLKIIREKIPEVVIGTTDPHQKVAGKGAKMLREAGCKVRTGILEGVCRDLNKRFFTFHEKRRPYIILKWAQTKDGLMDMERDTNSPLQPTWITNEVARALVHKWRKEEQAIMVGTNTAELDNPRLNVRDWSGSQPLRIVLDRHLRLPAFLHLFDRSIPTVVYNELKNEILPKLEYKRIDFHHVIHHVFLDLYERDIQSLFVEGGAELLLTFIESNLWDEARVFTGDKLFYRGVRAPEIQGKLLGRSNFDGNYLHVYQNVHMQNTSGP